MSNILSILRVILVMTLIICFILRFLQIKRTYLDWKMLVVLAILLVLILPFKEFDIATLITGVIK